MSGLRVVFANMRCARLEGCVRDLRFPSHSSRLTVQLPHYEYTTKQRLLYNGSDANNGVSVRAWMWNTRIFLRLHFVGLPVTACTVSNVETDWCVCVCDALGARACVARQ